MVNNGNNQFSGIPNNIPDKKNIIRNHIFKWNNVIGCSPDWNFFKKTKTKNKNKKQKQKTKTKNKNKKRNKCFTNLTIFVFT